jgi:hypothetical protein
MTGEGEVIGVDLALKVFLVPSNGEVIQLPRCY